MYVDTRCQFVVDCEYSGETFELISLAVVPLWPDSGKVVGVDADPSREFYEVIHPLPQGLSPWVQENVIPYLGQQGISRVDLSRRFESFLQQHRVQELHYDWPDDIAYVNRLMITGPGERLSIPSPFLSHIHHPGIEVYPKTPHNALHDARAIAAALRIRLSGLS